MPRSHRGLDSSIGTFTHGERRDTQSYVSRLSRRAELKQEISALEEKIAKRNSVLYWQDNPHYYCGQCGQMCSHMVHHSCESRLRVINSWNEVYCYSCGVCFTLEQYVAQLKDELVQQRQKRLEETQAAIREVYALAKLDDVHALAQCLAAKAGCLPVELLGDFGTVRDFVRDLTEPALEELVAAQTERVKRVPQRKIPKSLERVTHCRKCARRSAPEPSYPDDPEVKALSELLTVLREEQKSLK